MENYVNAGKTSRYKVKYNTCSNEKTADFVENRRFFSAWNWEKTLDFYVNSFYTKKQEWGKVE